jgi:uncharacterized membrane protein YedE/YeeE
MTILLPRQSAASMFSGILFGAGLAIAEMTNPAKVQNFLDIAGNWDLSLLFVMASGILVMALTYPVVRQCSKPVLGDSFSLPQRTDLPPRLFIGAAMFGIGWGLIGLCPGPAVTGLLQFQWEFYLFAASMIAAMKIYSFTAFADTP